MEIRLVISSREKEDLPLVKGIEKDCRDITALVLYVILYFISFFQLPHCYQLPDKQYDF